MDAIPQQEIEFQIAKNRPTRDADPAFPHFKRSHPLYRCYPNRMPV
jgi:hypothetical protein